LALVRAIADRTRLPLIVGGGIRNAEQAAALYDAGATLVVVGTALEQPGAEKLFQALQSIRL
jgi:heptaprenylglyceryl phosphate synthase